MPNKPTILLSLALSLTGCRLGLDESVESDHLTNTLAQNGRCTVLENRRFASLDPLECGIAPGSVSLCSWAIQFSALDADASSFGWRYSDVGGSGSVACDGDLVHVTMAGRTFDATYDPLTRQLAWDSVTYAAP